MIVEMVLTKTLQNMVPVVNNFVKKNQGLKSIIKFLKYQN